jgi:hypothetical protein
MKSIVSIFIFLIFLLLAGQASASYWFKVVDVSPISIEPNSDANFTVAVKGLGSEGAYVQVVFRNMSEGLSIASFDKLRYVFPTGTARFNFTLRAGDIAPGNYSFEVGVVGKSSLPGWTKAYVDVVGAGTRETRAMEDMPASGRETASQNISELPAAAAPLPAAPEAPAQDENASDAGTVPAQERGMPGPGTVMAIAALLLMGRRIRIGGLE